MPACDAAVVQCWHVVQCSAGAAVVQRRHVGTTVVQHWCIIGMLVQLWQQHWWRGDSDINGEVLGGWVLGGSGMSGQVLGGGGINWGDAGR